MTVTYPYIVYKIRFKNKKKPIAQKKINEGDLSGFYKA